MEMKISSLNADEEVKVLSPHAVCYLPTKGMCEKS